MKFTNALLCYISVVTKSLKCLQKVVSLACKGFAVTPHCPQRRHGNKKPMGWFLSPFYCLLQERTAILAIHVKRTTDIHCRSTNSHQTLLSLYNSLPLPTFSHQASTQPTPRSNPPFSFHLLQIAFVVQNVFPISFQYKQKMMEMWTSGLVFGQMMCHFFDWRIVQCCNVEPRAQY